MKKQISFIAPGQTAKALILVYLTFSVPIVLLGLLVAFFRYGSVELSTVTSALLLNAILGFILLWIACHAYNWVASRFGGIEIVLSDVPEEALMSTQIRLAAPADAGVHDALFGARPSAEALVAEENGHIVGYALFFQNYSTFLGKRGLFLEDLYVKPATRGSGLGTQMLRALAALAVERQCSRFEWTVLDWNQNAIGFYEKMGGQPVARLAHRAHYR